MCRMSGTSIPMDTIRLTGETICTTSLSWYSRRMSTRTPSNGRRGNDQATASGNGRQRRSQLRTLPKEIKDDFKPAPTNQAGKEYPQVNSQGRIKFRVVAPEAKSVATTFRDSTEFVKGDDGAWIGYSRPLDEGFHYYELVIDGAHVPDPNSKYYFGAMRWGSGIEIPAHDRDFYALKNVPHGQVREIFFHSESTDTERRAFVYTPPGYDSDQEKRYPVLYLQHGWGENEYGWSVQGHAGLIMDNLDRGRENQAIHHRDDLRDDQRNPLRRAAQFRYQ